MEPRGKVTKQNDSFKKLKIRTHSGRLCDPRGGGGSIHARNLDVESGAPLKQGLQTLPGLENCLPRGVCKPRGSTQALSTISASWQATP